MNAVPPDNAYQGAGRLPLAVRWGSEDFVRLTVVGIYQVSLPNSNQLLKPCLTS